MYSLGHRYKDTHWIFHENSPKHFPPQIISVIGAHAALQRSRKEIWFCLFTFCCEESLLNAPTLILLMDRFGWIKRLFAFYFCRLSAPSAGNGSGAWKAFMRRTTHSYLPESFRFMFICICRPMELGRDESYTDITAAAVLADDLLQRRFMRQYSLLIVC